MMLKLVVGIVILVASAHGAAALTAAAATDPLDADLAGDTRNGFPPASAIWAQPAARSPVQVVTPAAPVQLPERALSANPLWAIPLTALSSTRDRPIFSSSRRPPAPAVAPAIAAKVIVVPKPREPERPPLSLVGTIASSDEGFGIFLDQTTKAALRLKIGEDYQGWKLRAILGREVTLEKDQQAITLELPQRGLANAGEIRDEVRPPPAKAGKLLSVTSQPRSDDRSGR